MSAAREHFKFIYPCKKNLQIKMEKLVNNLKSKINKTKFNKKPSTFCDYEQRDYDFDDLERKLLGWD